MYPGSPIPESAKPDDPLWTGRFLDLAATMVVLGAKPTLVMRYTGLNSKAVAERYLRLTGKQAPKGRLQQTQPRNYAIAHNRGGYGWTIQAAAFANIYLQMEQALGFAPNRGWLLATAYEAYCHLTDSMQEAIPNLVRITFNNAYDLMIHLGYGLCRRSAPLALHACPDCGTPYLVMTQLELDQQQCPMCSIHKRFTTLVENAATLARKRDTQEQQFANSAR